jgi:hypothetical protein
MKYRFSLQTMLVVAMIAPALLAGAYFLTDLIRIFPQVPETLESPAAGNPNIRVFNIVDDGEVDNEQVLIFINSTRVMRFHSRISKIEAEKKVEVIVSQLSPTSVSLVGQEQGAVELIVWLTSGKKMTITVCVVPTP